MSRQHLPRPTPTEPKQSWDQHVRALLLSDDPADRLAARAAVACQYVGHPGRPRWFLRRFRSRPWRCERCGSWWITSRVDHYEGSTLWLWTYIGHDKENLA